MAAADVGFGSGELILPAGVYFIPTNDEALGYLKRKILGQELPAFSFPTADVYGTAPHRLPFGRCNYAMRSKCSYLRPYPYEWYFYTTRQSHELVTGNGYWTRKEDTEIDVDGKIEGFKQELVYYNGVLGSGQRTSWRIWEYRMNPQSINAPEELYGDVKEKIANFVLCKVFLKMRSAE